MSARIEIVSSEVVTRKGKAKATGNDYTIHRQEGYLHNGHAYPDRFEFGPPVIDDKPVPYKPGFYTIAPGALQVNREYGGLELNRFELKLLEIPAPVEAKK